MVGIVDMACPGPLLEMEALIDGGELQGLQEGGFRFRDAVTLIPGAEVEVLFHAHPVHALVYVPDLESLKGLGRWYASHARNPSLGVQRVGDGDAFLREASPLGVIVQAHAFTPFRGYYAAEGRLGDRLRFITGLELGLSADTQMVGGIEELQGVTFLSNSDAHSLRALGREHNLLEVRTASFCELAKALRQEGGRAVIANFGLDPRLGKYHRSHCHGCDTTFLEPPPVLACPRCGRHALVQGVLDRVTAIAGKPQGAAGSRPPYHHLIPPYMVPGVGPRTLERLVNLFGSEMAIVHKATRQEILQALGEPLASGLWSALRGQREVTPGGGGVYGQVR
jgi:uncharacterized protein (TIGR00375 family)